MSGPDGPVLDRWWQAFVATGRLHADLEPVQARLVRAVHRGALPSGEVYVKSMTFPRWKDRLRYALRPLPAAHEAAVLGAAAAAGIACPAVVAVRTLRRAGLPCRSMLVLRALPVAEVPPADAVARLGDEARLAQRLLAAGIVHRDLHSGNFVPLADGSLAVLDMQSAAAHGGPRLDRKNRIAAAARLLRGKALEHAAAVVAGGLLADAGELEQARLRAARELAHFDRSRVRRCFGESTEFTRALRWNGLEHRLRGPLPAGHWRSGDGALRRCWIGQRALQVFENRPPVFPAFFQKWWWLGGKASLYVPAQCSADRIEAELAVASGGFVLFRTKLEKKARHLYTKDG